MKKLAMLLAVLLWAAPLSAQEAFKQVWVTQSDSGTVLHGRLVDLSHDSLAVLTADNRRVEIPIDRVLRIEAHGDSLRNGAAMGAAIFGGLSVLACQGYSHGGGCAVGSILNLGIGALIGAGVDALNGGRSVLYTRPAAIAPPKSAAMHFTLRF